MYDLTLPAPAKINRFLHIIGKRSDGYHNLQTLFQFLDVGDELHFTPADQLSLTTSLTALDNDDNLILQAARLLMKAAGVEKGVHITLTKNLPVGGGLGGGSSNAATVLLGLNHLWGLNFSQDRLAALGLRLGADVPVFVRGKSAFAEGVGEQLTPMEPNEPWLVVLTPDAHVNTAQMYSHPDLTRDTPPIPVCAALNQSARNDFEPLVRRCYPTVDKCLHLLDNFDHSSIGSALMSGSGACVFSPFGTREEAVAALHAIAPKAEGFVARGINNSPLHSVLKRLSLV